MTIGLVPYFEKVLLEYNPVVSAVSIGSLALFVNFSGYTGLAVHKSFISKILAYDVLWLLEDCPLPAHLPLHLVLVLMHVGAHMCTGTVWSLPNMLLGYVGLGLVLPVVVSGALLPSNSQAKVPGALHTALGATVVGYLLLDQLLRAPPLAEPMQDAAAAGRSLLASGVVSMMEAPAPGAAYGYGLPESTGLGIMWSTLMVLLLSAFVSVIGDGDGMSLQGLANRTLLASLSKNSAASALLNMLRGLPPAKMHTVLGMVAITLLQGVGMVSIAAGLALQGPESFVHTAPAVLLGIMLGVVMQVVGVLYVLVPSGDAGPAAPQHSVCSVETTAPATVAISDTTETASRSTSVGGGTTPGTLKSLSMLTRANVLAQDNLMGVVTSSAPNGVGAGNVDSCSMLSGMSRGASERFSHIDAADDSSPDLRSRIEALANFKTFMQGLDQQPGVYSLEEFIRGAATAMKGIFPGVAHASFCLLNSTRNCVNMYTFLGDGSRKPPRINVAVAPGTLIYHVLHNCQPVFISNVAAFPGPYADVQFMRFVLNLRSVACLPLVVAGSRVLGVLRLGFEESWNWTEQEKSIAKQLALVLSSTSTGMGVSGGGLHPMVAAQPSIVYDARGKAVSAATAAAEAGYPNVAAVLAASGGGGGMAGSAPHVMQDDGSSSYGSAQPLFSLPHQHSLPYQQLYGGAGASGPQHSPGSGGGANGSVRRLRGGSRSTLQYVSGAYPAGPGPGPGSFGGADSGLNFGTTPSTANTIPAAGNSNRSSVDHNGYYSSLAGPGGPGLLPADLHAQGIMGGVAGGGGYGASMHSNYSSGVHTGAVPSSSGSGHHPAAGDIDETWLLQQPASSQVRRALAGPAQAQGHGAGADIKMLEVIGRGGFGSVYKAFWRGMVVAVKVLEHEDEMVPGSGGTDGMGKVDTSSRRAALLEGAMTSTISHPHVVQTYDYRVVHLDPQSSINGIMRSRVLHETHIIMEFCDRGSLQDAIEQGVFVVDGPRGARGGSTEPEVDMELIIMTLAEVSGAMEYLHKHRITHRDLKPKNILLRSSAKDRRGYVSKVSDFGLSQVLPDTNKTQVSTKYSGTVTHMAPELIEDGKVYQQGDLYAFGIIMWEIFTSLTPYQNMAHPQIMVGVVTHNLRPKFPVNCPEWYKNLAYRCWRKDPKTRPPFAEVTKTLLGMLPDKQWSPAE